MVKANLLPQKISTLGIDFEQINQTVLLRSVALLILYFLIAFLLYSTSDFLTWRIAYKKVVKGLAENEDANTERDRSRVDYSLEERLIDSSVGPVAALRALFEFIIPVIIATYAVLVLLRK